MPDFAKVISPTKLVAFYHTHVPTGAQLLPTFPVLDFDWSDSNLATLTKKENTFLKTLNTVATTNRYSYSCGDPTKVYTKAFASNNVSTLIDINVFQNTLLQQYPDGIPVGESPTKENGGDGTVPASSAVADALSFSYLAANKGSHYQLMYAFRNEIGSFLSEVCP